MIITLKMVMGRNGWLCTWAYCSSVKVAVSQDMLHKSQLQQAAFAPPFDLRGCARNALSVKNVYLMINEYLLHFYIELWSFFSTHQTHLFPLVHTTKLVNSAFLYLLIISAVHPVSLFTLPWYANVLSASTLTMFVTLCIFSFYMFFYSYYLWNYQLPKT